METDRSVSKTAEEILKATALFGIYSFVSNQASRYYNCSADLDMPSYISTMFVSVVFFWLGAAVIIDRVKNLYPWIFVGRNWSGVFVYSLILALCLVLVAPVGKILLTTTTAMSDPSKTCN